jgi:SAM-dependent methyltransferase
MPPAPRSDGGISLISTGIPRLMNPRLKHLEMRFRALAPQPLRTAYRIVRSLTATHALSPALPEDLVANCRMCADRWALIDRLPKGGVVAELGTYKGDFAREILARTAPQQLHLIDIDFTGTDRLVLDDPRVTQHHGLTHQTIATFPDAHFDWIYVDADHSYAGVARDAAASAAKLKPGGYLIFNDFAHIDPFVGRYGVHRAVIEFAIAHRWPMAFFAFNPAALYDVALQKPSLQDRDMRP